MGTDRERLAGVVIADATQPGFPLVYVSEGFEQLTGYPASELLGGSCGVLQGPDSDPRAVDVMRRALADGREAYVTLVNYRSDGTAFWNEVALAPERDVHGRVVRYLGIQKDVTGRIDAMRRIDQLSRLDPLTGLANRAALRDELGPAITSAQVSDRQVALLSIGIDDFREVNGAHGYAAGDHVLREVADRLRAAVRPEDLLARAGGDEFLLLVRDVEDVWSTAGAIATRVLRCLHEPVELPVGRRGPGPRVAIRASVGVSRYPRDARTAEDLLGHADRALQIAKRAGKDRVHVHRAGSAAGPADEDFDPLGAVPELEAILARGAIRPIFQPIVSLDDDAVVAYEALARGPRGSALERPDRLFAAAKVAGLVTELDWLCRARAVEAALVSGLGRSAYLFLNCEPAAIGTACPERHAALWARARRELELVLEITERAVTSRPAELSRVVAEQRAAGRGIALDDLGADVRSLALLPFVEPDVIKLDLRLVQDRPSTEQAAIVSAVAAERERTGAAVLAEGVETREHVSIARALGASLGQGYLWGRPGPLPSVAPRPAPARERAWRRPSVAAALATGRTPFEVVAAGCPTATTTKSLLLPMSHHLENRALQIGEGAVVLSAFQDARHFTPSTAIRYRLLHHGASLVAALAVGLDVEPVAGVRGASIGPDDPLAGEWSVLVVAPHFAGALVARDLGDAAESEPDRRFAFATTYRRELVIAAARTLLERVVPLTEVPALR
ncbi:MAG TPA: EAL domain-containing protein [Solirubrobacteraceae bacterium]|nr:EAL domain-containing protein [Solirubrobacteraceae bacterium]